MSRSFLFLFLVISTVSCGWRQLIYDQEPTSPPGRYYHCSNFSPLQPELLYIFAGVEYQNPQTFAVNDVWKVNVSQSPNFVWQRVNVSGDIPPPRGYHSCSVGSDGLWYIFGGKTEPAPGTFQITYYNDLWTFDFATSTWKNIFPSDTPSTPRKRFWASSTSTPTGQIILFGGYGIDPRYPGMGVMNDLWVYDLNQTMWFQVYVNNTPGSPPPRQGHTASLSDDAQNVIVFGGEQLLGGLNDIWLYSLAFRTWKQLQSGQAPAGRSGHSAALLNGLYYIFAGSYITTGQELYYNDLWYYNFTSSAWVQVEASTDQPDESQPWKRKAASATILSSNSKSFYLFGGYGLYQGLKNDFWQYNLLEDSSKIVL